MIAALLGRVRRAIAGHRGAARRAARCRRSALQLRRERRRAPARSMRGDALVAARARARDARVSGADPRRRARPMSGRRTRGRARGRPDLRRAGRAARPARNEARRVRAGSLVPAAVPRQPAGAPRTCCSPAASVERRRGEGDGPRRTSSPPIPRRRRARLLRAHLAGKSAAALACAVAAARGPIDPRRCAAGWRRSSGSTSTRLMQTRDANEGLVAFLAKRQPHWEHR